MLRSNDLLHFRNRVQMPECVTYSRKCSSWQQVLSYNYLYYCTSGTSTSTWHASTSTSTSTQRLYYRSSTNTHYMYNKTRNSSYLATGWRPLAEGHFPVLVRLHGTVFLHFWETKRYPWTLLSIVSNVFVCYVLTQRMSALEILNDSALYKFSLNNNNNNNNNNKLIPYHYSSSCCCCCCCCCCCSSSSYSC